MADSVKELLDSIDTSEQMERMEEMRELMEKMECFEDLAKRVEEYDCLKNGLENELDNQTDASNNVSCPCPDCSSLF